MSIHFSMRIFALYSCIIFHCHHCLPQINANSSMKDREVGSKVMISNCLVYEVLFQPLKYQHFPTTAPVSTVPLLCFVPMVSLYEFLYFIGHCIYSLFIALVYEGQNFGGFICFVWWLARHDVKWLVMEFWNKEIHTSNFD